MMHQALLLVILCTISLASAMYDGRSAVKTVNDKEFKDEVLKFDGVAIVEFYAPWCGHCKNLEPEYEKAAKILKGVVKVIAVDATLPENSALAQKYGVQGFPTLKVFGVDKKKPVDYNGARTGDAIVTELMKAANQLVKDRKGGKASSSGGSSGGGSSSKPSGSKKSGSGSDSYVFELTETNFNALVMESTDHWLVEFYAPWCGHCKNLAPEWQTAASQLHGQVKLGAVDATVHTNLAQKYGVKGYPTIKVFSAGKKGNAKDYNGPREADGIVQYALQSLDAAGVPISIPEIVSSTSFDEACVKSTSSKICVVAFLPHILDSTAKGRNALLDTVQAVAKEFRGKQMSFMWVEGGSQPHMETLLDVNNVYPTVSILSPSKMVYATQKVSWSEKNVKGFLNGILGGKEKKAALSQLPSLVKVPAWDGKDAKPPVDEISLDELFGDDEKI